MRFGQSARACGYHFHGWLLLLALLFVSAVPPVLGAQNPKQVHLRLDNESPKKVFLLEGLAPVEPSVQTTVDALMNRFTERSPEDIEIYSDFLELGSYRGQTDEDRLLQFLAAKFDRVRPDIIISMSRSAVAFALKQRSELAPGIPIIYCCAAVLKNDAQNIPPDIPGVVLEIDWAGTLALAERLQPNAKTIVLISDTPGYAEMLERDVPGALRPLLQNHEIRYLAGLPYDEVLKQVSRLPRDSIVLLRRIFQDGSGRSRGAEFGADVSRASAAPVYSASITYFGSGIVGGHMESKLAEGEYVADLALDILSGKNPSSLPHQTKLPLQYRVDARQLERWGFAETFLPPGTSVEFRQPSMVERYGPMVVRVLLALAVLVGFIALLLLEIRKRQEAENARRTAEAESELRRREVTHLMRVGIVSELSGGIAHELGQPLASILANAQAAQRLVATNRTNKNEIAEMLDDIIEEDRRAAEVIYRLRQLLKREERAVDKVDLNENIASTLGLVHSELVSRRII